MTEAARLTVQSLSGISTTLGQVSVSAGHTLEIGGVVDLSKNHGAFQLPVGNTGQRPNNPKAGYLRWNTDNDAEGNEIGVEYFDGYQWYQYGQFTERAGATSSAAVSYSAAFDGSGDYLLVPSPSNGWNFQSSENWTVELWMKDGGSTPSDATLLEFYQNSGSVSKYKLRRNGASYIFEEGTTAYLSHSGGWNAINDGNWHYIVIDSRTTGGTTYWKMHLNGSTVATHTFNGTHQAVKGDRLTVGANKSGGSAFLGNISNLRITNASLQPTPLPTPISALTTTSQGATTATVELLMLSLNAVTPSTAVRTPGQIVIYGNTAASEDNPFAAGGGGGVGEAIFHADGPNGTTNYSWDIPAGVSKISVISVGGGGGGEANHDGAGGGGGALAYKNDIDVTGQSTVTVYVGGGGMAQGWGSYGPNGGNSYIQVAGSNHAYAGGGTGGKGNYSSGCHNIPGGSFSNSTGGGNGGNSSHYGGCRQAGGAAGGYSGGGGQGSGRVGNRQYSGCTSQDGQAGGGGGGASCNGSSNYYSNGGGGTGIYGQGSNGQRGGPGGNSYPNNSTDFCGKGGSTAHNTGFRGYSNRSSNSTFSGTGSGYNRYHPSYNSYTSYTCPDGGFPGGGGGGGNSGDSYGMGGHGVVRIIYGKIDGNDRGFPSTGVDLSTEYDGNYTVEENGTQKMY